MSLVNLAVFSDTKKSDEEESPLRQTINKVQNEAYEKAKQAESLEREARALDEEALRLEREVS